MSLTFALYTYEILESVLKYGFKKLLFINEVQINIHLYAFLIENILYISLFYPKCFKVLSEVLLILW